VQDQAEPDVGVARVGVDVVAGRYAAVVHMDAPVAAAENTRTARSRSSRIIIGTYTIISTMIPVITPLPDITCHIINIETVGRKTAHRRCIGIYPVIPGRMITSCWTYVIAI